MSKCSTIRKKTKMSRFVDSVLRLVQSDKDRHKDRQKLRNGRKKFRKRRDRSLQYADSFIFVPGEINRVDAENVNSPLRFRANTCADNLLLSPPSQAPFVNGNAAGISGGLGRSLKSRISQEVEDVARDENRGSQDAYFAEKNGMPNPPSTQALSYEIRCPPGERYCHIRPYSSQFGITEYSRPSDCIRPTNSWHHANDSDLESVGEGIQSCF